MSAPSPSPRAAKTAKGLRMRRPQSLRLFADAQSDGNTRCHGMGASDLSIFNFQFSIPIHAMRSATLTFALFLTACASFAPPAHDGSVSDRLFCGLSIPGGGAVTQEQLDAFVADTVEVRFPDGFTIWRARGLWRGGAEDVVVFEIVHPADAALDAKVAEIAREYRRRFAQEAVFRVITPARTQLFTAP